MIYLTSDWHLYHDNIMKYVSTRDTHRDIDDYMTGIMRTMRMLRPEDTLVFMGDLALGPRKSKLGIIELLSRIPGEKHFLRGNHDAWLSDTDILQMGFKSVRDYILLQNFCNADNSQNSQSVLICHYPFDQPKPKPQPGSTYEPHNYLWDLFYENPNIKTIYHGHIHAEECKRQDGIKRINCSIDAKRNEFRVVPITGALANQIIQALNTKV